jgi:hypothetical protein
LGIIFCVVGRLSWPMLSLSSPGAVTSVSTECWLSLSAIVGLDSSLRRDRGQHDNVLVIVFPSRFGFPSPSQSAHSYRSKFLSR